MSLRQLARALSTQIGSTRIPSDRIQDAISPQVCLNLQRQGFAIVDGFLGDSITEAVRAEIISLRPHMHRNCTHLVSSSGETCLLPKKDIMEVELMAADTRALAPLCSQLQFDATLRTMLCLNLPQLSLDIQSIKLQWNSGEELLLQLLYIFQQLTHSISLFGS